MDCETFESAMRDALVGNLDELTSAAARRHAAGCPRCSARLGGLRTPRRVSALPFADASSDLRGRILVTADPGVVPTAASQPRLAQFVSLAGSWAMRPQSAMVAVFLVMIGTSVLLLRGKSARAPLSADVTVTEQGTPAPETPAPSFGVETTRAKPIVPPALADAKPPGQDARPPAPSATRDLAAASSGATGAPMTPFRTLAEGASPELPDPRPDDLFDAALRSYRAGRFEDAARAFDALGPADPNSPDLWAARAVRDGKGCRAAVGRFDKTAARYKQSPPGWDATLEGALCYRALGELGTARARLATLLGIDSHKDRARVELDRIDELQQAQATGEGRSKALTKSRASASPTAAATGVTTDSSH